MSKKRHSPEFKAKLVLETLKAAKPLHALALQSGIHPVQIAEVHISVARQYELLGLPVRGGFSYLVAVLDRYGRTVLAWEPSNALDDGFCIEYTLY